MSALENVDDESDNISSLLYCTMLHWHVHTQ